MKFLADVGISMSTVQALRDSGYKVIHLREQGLQRLPDAEIVKKAMAEGRQARLVCEGEDLCMTGPACAGLLSRFV